MVSLSTCKHNVSKISNKYCENKSDKISVGCKFSKANTMRSSHECSSGRVFSHGGIVVRPHRSSLAPQRLNKILSLKCNKHVFDASKLL